MSQKNTLEFIEIYGIDPVELARIHESFDKKQAWIEKSYECLTGKKLFSEDKTDKEKNAEQVIFYSLFLASLYENKIKLKNRIFFDIPSAFLKFDLQYKPGKLKTLSPFDALKLCAGEDELRPQSKTVCFEDGYLITTDCYKMLCYKPKNPGMVNYDILGELKNTFVKNQAKISGLIDANKHANDHYSPYLNTDVFRTLSGESFDVYTGQKSENRFYQWRTVNPVMSYSDPISDCKLYEKNTLFELLDLCTMYLEVYKNVDKKINLHIVLNFAGELITFDLHHLIESLQAFLSIEKNEMLNPDQYLLFYASNKCLAFYSESGSNCIVMPICTNKVDGDQVKHHYVSKNFTPVEPNVCV